MHLKTSVARSAFGKLILRNKRLDAVAGIVITCVLLSGCGKEGTSVESAGPPANMQIVSGNAQSASIETELSNPVVVKVLDAAQRPVPNRLINFRVVAGGGSVFGGAALTNADGLAQERWTLGTTIGEQKLEARAVDPGTGEALVFATFTATAVAGPATKLAVFSPPSALAPNRAPFPAPPVIVAHDARGNIVVTAGTVVTVALVSGGGTLSGNLTATTNASGVAQFSGLSIAGTVGPRTLQFSAPNLVGVAANVTITAGSPSTIVATAGNNQTSAIGNDVPVAPAVLIADQDGNAVPGVGVTYAVGSGGGSVTGASPVTGSNGVATVGSWKLGTALGANTLTASVAGLSGSPVTFSATGIGFLAQMVSAGEQHTCALDLTGAAWCWGTNSSGQLGDGTKTTRLIPVQVSGGLTFQSITAGAAHTCAVTPAGVGYCWGLNPSGQLATGAITDRMVPTPILGGLTFRMISAGRIHTCGVTTSNAAYCWGDNNYGQIGDGATPAMANHRTEVTAVADNHSFQSVTAGSRHTCGVATNGSMYCWGDNASGQLGDGTAGSIKTRPSVVTGGLGFSSASVANDLSSCGLLVADGAARCWGKNGAGQLGDGTTADRYTPSAVTGGLLFKELEAGSTHACAVTSTNAAYCWGDNSAGQLGDGTTSGRLTPTAVVLSGGVRAVTAGGSHSCGITSDQVVVCWGSNANGQLGDGTSTTRMSPIPVRPR